MRELCRRITHQMSESGWLAPGLDPEEEAEHLHALVNGLAVHGLVRRLDNETMLDIRDSHLDRIIRYP